MAYDFHYTPTGTGVISGKEVLEQTEDAINDLGNTAISGVQEALDKAEQALTNSANAVDDAQTALNTANNAEGVAIQAQTDVGNLSGTVTNIGNRVTTAEGNITNLQGRMTTAEGNITNLQGRMTTAESNIGNLQTAVSTAQATANSAQQTATTARQQSYVFRYSGTAITNNSTIAYSTIDNTDNIKSGDKILDVDGKLFEITAVDTTNQTVTVGTALIDLAKDIDVVHTSGTETISGAKYFNDIIYSIGGIQTRLNTRVSSGESSSKSWAFVDNAYKSLFKLVVSTSTNKSTGVQYIIYNVDSNDTETLNRITWQFNNNSSVSELRPIDNAIKLGTSLYRWSEVYATNYYYGSNNVEFSTKFVTTDTNQTISGNKTFSSINGVEPSSLSLPSDRSARIDISGYFTNTGTGNTNDYSVPDNGFIFLNLLNAFAVICYSIDGTNNVNYAQSFFRQVDGQIYILFPVRKNDTFRTLWTSNGGTITVTGVYFIPCQGNI